MIDLLSEIHIQSLCCALQFARTATIAVTRQTSILLHEETLIEFDKLSRFYGNNP